jgi:NCAIR mutase (PurE)-related protein
VNEQELLELLAGVRSGEVEMAEAVQKLKAPHFEDIGIAKVDTHRALRKGFPEVVYCEGKTKDEVVTIVDRILQHEDNLLATRAAPEVYEAVKERHSDAQYNERARTITVERKPLPKRGGTILVVSAGTSDMDVAEEAVVTAKMLGNEVESTYDVGVAGIHRLLSQSDKLRQASVIIVVAGMEGALPSVVAGLVDKPVIAVPTSKGYGANFGGIAPLLAMLNSCASGVTVVNIDNGFGAAYSASLINRSIASQAAETA